MLKKLTLTVLIFLLLVSVAPAIEIHLHNDTQKPLFFSVTWLGCDWKGWNGVCTISMGEIKPNEDHKLLKGALGYKTGTYVVEWRLLTWDEDYRPNMPSKFYKYDVTNPNGILKSTPAGIEFFPGS